MKGTCSELSTNQIVPTKRGTPNMKASGLERIEVWVNPDRKRQVRERCRQQGIALATFVSTAINDKLNSAPL